MKRIYIDNNILSKLLKDEKFSIKFRKKYHCDETLIYISIGTLLEQYKGEYYDRQIIIDLELILLLKDSDVEKYENNRLDNFWDNKIIRKKEIKQFYYELDNHEQLNETKYFDRLIELGERELDIWRKNTERVRNKYQIIGKMKPKDILNIASVEFSKGLFTLEFLGAILRSVKTKLNFSSLFTLFL